MGTACTQAWVDTGIYVDTGMHDKEILEEFVDLGLLLESSFHLVYSSLLEQHSFLTMLLLGPRRICDTSTGLHRHLWYLSHAGIYFGQTGVCDTSAVSQLY